MFHSPQVSSLQDSPSIASKFGSREVLHASRNFSGNAPDVLSAKIDRLISSKASRNTFRNSPEVLAAQVECLINSRGPRDVLQAFGNSSGNAPKILAAKVDHLIRSRAPSNISENAPEVLAAQVDHLIRCRGAAVSTVFRKAPENAPEVLAAKVDHLISCRGTTVSTVFRKGCVLRPTQCKAVHCLLPNKLHGDTLCRSQWVTNNMEHCGGLQYAQPPHQYRSQRVTQNTGSFVPPRALMKTSVFQSRTHLPRKRDELLEQLNAPKTNVNYLPKPWAPAPPCFSRKAQHKNMQCILPHETGLDTLCRSQHMTKYMGKFGYLQDVHPPPHKEYQASFSHKTPMLRGCRDINVLTSPAWRT